MAKTLLGIDWGTSNRRAYLVEEGGGCLAQHADGEGLLKVGGEFKASLASLQAALGIDPALPGLVTIMSGMVGSASGWQEVPYLDTATALAELPRHLVPVKDQAHTYIVPGYRASTPSVDVMRGEETQLLGALAMGVADGWVVLPGTHSKWVLLQAGRIASLSTYMTGELFAMLGQSGTLSAMLRDGPDDDAAAFRAGLEAARLRQPMSHGLFTVRASVVTGAMPATQARSFVSGLLIGTEFVHADEHTGPLHLIASPALAARYAAAASYFGIAARVLDPDAVYRAALQTFFSELP